MHDNRTGVTILDQQQQTTMHDVETLHISQLMYLLRGLQWQSSKGVWQWRWAAHITFIMFYLKLAPTPAFDRLTCYGTSYASDFHDTHCYPVPIALIQWVTQNEDEGKNHLPVLKICSWNLRIDPLFSSMWRILYMQGFQALPKGSSINQGGSSTRNGDKNWYNKQTSATELYYMIIDVNGSSAEHCLWLVYYFLLCLVILYSFLQVLY